MPRGDTDLGVDPGRREETSPPQAVDRDPPLTEHEALVLEALSCFRTGGTPAQLRARCDLSIADLGVALEGLRAKGLVTRLNTVVESYAARFPGLKVT